MTYVVTENCIKCKYTDCVEVCPVDCFHEGPSFLVIDPDVCTGCSRCTHECPAEAIYAAGSLPEGMERFVSLNAEYADLWPTITRARKPLSEANVYNGMSDKLEFLEL